MILIRVIVNRRQRTTHAKSLQVYIYIFPEQYRRMSGDAVKAISGQLQLSLSIDDLFAVFRKRQSFLTRVSKQANAIVKSLFSLHTFRNEYLGLNEKSQWFSYLAYFFCLGHNLKYWLLCRLRFRTTYVDCTKYVPCFVRNI